MSRPKTVHSTLAQSHARAAALTRHRADAYQQLMLALRVITHVCPSHLMNAVNNKHQRVLCIHDPRTDKQMAWLLFTEEQEKLFDHLPSLDESHSDGHTRGERDTRLMALLDPNGENRER